MPIISEDELKKKNPDLQIYTDSDGHRYTKDSLVRGIYRFVSFTDSPVKKDSNGNIVSGGKETPLDPGVFKRNPNGWNIQAACNWLHSNAGSSSQHACAKYVRMGIEAGGLSTAGRPTWAWKYIDFLPTIGFKFIGKFGRNDSYRPEPGDIAVYQKGGNANVPGHICMWTGAEWASDFKQKSMIVYQSTSEAYVFRFDK